MPAIVSQKDIALKLGLSASTVAKVLNHDPLYRVAPDTRDIILRTASDMGYRNSRRRTGNIAFIVCGKAFMGEFENNRDICAEADSLRYRTFFVNKSQRCSYREISLSVNPLAADGAIVTGEYAPEAVAELSRVMPVVVIDERKQMEGVDRILSDHAVLAGRLTNHLLDAGHRHIALIVHTSENYLGQRQTEGYAQALNGRGLPFDTSMVYSKFRAFYPALIEDILNMKPRPTAMLACTISDSPVILSVLYTRGVHVPNDMSFIALGSAAFSELDAFPRLTCFDGYVRALSRAAVRRLMERIDNRELAAEDITVSVPVDPGETCAALGPAGRTGEDASHSSV